MGNTNFRSEIPEGEIPEVNDLNDSSTVITFQGLRTYMEDSYAFKQLVCPYTQVNMYAVFDGHSGYQTVSFLQQELLVTLTNLLIEVFNHNTCHNTSDNDQFKDVDQHEEPTDASLQLRIELAFIYTERKLYESQEAELVKMHSQDAELVKMQQQTRPAALGLGQNAMASGSCAIVACHIKNSKNKIMVANCGDCIGLLIFKNKTWRQVSLIHRPVEILDHGRQVPKPFLNIEMTRIKNSGQFIRNGRVLGDLAVTRSFGDFKYKGLHTSEAYHGVTCVPTVTIVDFEGLEPECLLLFSDGIADAMSNDELMNMVFECETVNEMLNKAVNKSWPITHDNTTLLRIKL